MTLKQLVQSACVMAFIMGLCISQAYGISARDQILNEITVSTEGEFTKITIGFNFPIRYVRHYPQSLGDEVRIEFDPLQATLNDIKALESRESLFPPANNSGITRVEYEGKDMADPTITVSFDRRISFQVKQGEDFRSLVVLLPISETQQKQAETIQTETILGLVSRYIINLYASLEPIAKEDYPPPETTKEYNVYTAQDKKMDGTLWHRLAVGFFETFSQARKVADKLFIKDYPKLWIEKASPEEVINNGGGGQEVSATVPVDTTPVSRPGLDQQKQDYLLKEGTQSMAQKDYPRAIQIFTKLLESTDPEIMEQAQFQLDLAREFNGHLAHAKAEYRNYLVSYPQGKNAPEARNRLNGLLSARPLMSGEKGKVGVFGQSGWESEFYGSISTFYDYDKSYSDEDDESEETTNVSALTTSLDATYRLTTDNYVFKTVFIGSYEASFLEDEEDENRVSAFYLDFQNKSGTFTSRWGRQSGSSGGVLGRFDGGQMGYLIFEKVRLNLVAGFPVNLSSDPIDNDRYFYGINFDFGRFYNHWDFNLFFIDQMAESIADRRAVGGEVRFVGDSGSLFTMVDYDILYNELNTVLIAGNWLMPNKKTWINFSADFRNNPALATSNALIGQTNPSLEALEASIGEKAMRQLAEDRTLESKFVTLGFSHPFTDEFQFSGDVSWSKLGGGPASGGVEEIPEMDDEWYYSVQFTKYNLFARGDISTLGLRYADAVSRDTSTLTFNTRYPLNDAWRINPKLQIDYRKNNVLTGDQWRFRPSLRVEYKFNKRWRAEFEGGYNYADKELEGLAEDRKGYYMSVGLRMDF